MKVRMFICLILLVSLPALVQAEIYRWVDNRGTVHYTDNLGNIPAKYRSKATLIDEGVGGQPEIREVTEEPKEKQPPAVKEGGEKEGISRESTERKKKVYGDKDEDAWRREFVRVRSELQRTEELLAERRKRLGETDKLSRSQYLALQYDVTNLEKRLETLRGKLSELETAANRAGVPPALRQ
ncbi:MAG: DUF4124 domain-containing protein [Geobacter sp.]|nr:DUF4124 domain-containing protein [Geobacter sp.]